MPDAPERTPAWAEYWVRLLDDGFRIPGTQWRIGLDGIVGLLLPAAGDALSAASALSLFFLAYQRRVPRSVLLRMALNVAIDALIGALPVLGDMFDFGWKANRRNLQLIERAAQQRSLPRQRASLGDRVFVVVMLLVLLGLLALPFLLSIYLLGKLLAPATAQ
jgi:hypothetical protein